MTAQDATQTVRRVTALGLAANLALSGLKFAAGLMGNSQAVVADAVHSLSDTISDVAVIVGSLYWHKPADHDHHYGHRRIETFVTLFVGAMLLAAAAGIVRQAVISFQGTPPGPPGPVAIAATFVSIVAKELLYRWTKRVGQQAGSQAMVANAWHHRTDAFSSIPALAAVTGSYFFPACWFLDGAGAIVVSFFILYAAYGILRPVIHELLDASAPPEVLSRIQKVSEETDGVLQVHKLRSRLCGTELHLDMHVVVNGDIPVSKGHDIAEEVKERLMNEDLNVSDVVVHIDPAERMK